MLLHINRPHSKTGVWEGADTAVPTTAALVAVEEANEGDDPKKAEADVVMLR